MASKLGVWIATPLSRMAAFCGGRPRTPLEAAQAIVSTLTHILTEVRKMSVTAAQAQADFDALTAQVTTVLPQAMALLNQLAAANASGQQLDPAKVEADIAAIKQQVDALGTTVNNDTPGGTPAPTPSSSSTPSA